MRLRFMFVVAALVPVVAAASPPAKSPEQQTIGPPVAARPDLDQLKRAQNAAWLARTAALSPRAGAALATSRKPAPVVTRTSLSESRLAAVRAAQAAKLAAASARPASRGALAPRAWGPTVAKPVTPSAPPGPAPSLNAAQRAKLATLHAPAGATSK